MKISTILEHIDRGYTAFPDFQRGHVCNRDGVPARPVSGRFRAILQQAMEVA